MTILTKIALDIVTGGNAPTFVVSPYNDPIFRDGIILGIIIGILAMLPVIVFVYLIISPIKKQKKIEKNSTAETEEDD